MSRHRLPTTILGPTQSVGVALKPPFGGENAVAAARRRQAQEIGFVAKQAKSVLHFPNDVEVAGARELCKRGIERHQGEEEGQKDGKAHDRGRTPPIALFASSAEM